MDQTGKIFTILHANLICFETSIHIEDLLSRPPNADFRLVFISSSDGGGDGGGNDQSYITTAFEKSMVSAPSPPRDAILSDYLKQHLTTTRDNEVSNKAAASTAEILDPELCKLRLVASQEFGNGKKYNLYPDFG